MTVGEAKRYAINGTGSWTAVEVKAGAWVRWYDYDAAQSELTALKAELASEEQDHAELRDVVAALREELRVANEYCDSEQTLMQSKLTAAEQRNAELIDLIQKAHTWVDRNNFGGWDAYELRDQLAAALKPTESGASE